MSNPPTFITGAGRSACPQEGAGNLSERFLAKIARHAQWQNAAATRSGRNRVPFGRERFLASERTVPTKRIAEC
jgi:hypothetical protein